MKTKQGYRFLLSGVAILCAVVLMWTKFGPTLYAVENTQQTKAEQFKTPACTLAVMDFTLNDINGKPVSLSQFKGKIVVLEWTNYDCPFVKAHYTPEKQTTAQLARKYADKDVVWLTINSTYYATPEATKEWAQKLNLPQTLLMDTGGKVGKLFGATNTPDIFIFSKEGNLAYKGAIDNAPLGKSADAIYINFVDRALGELTSGNPVSIIETRPYGCSVKYPPEKTTPAGNPAKP